MKNLPRQGEAGTMHFMLFKTFPSAAYSADTYSHQAGLQGLCRRALACSIRDLFPSIYHKLGVKTVKLTDSGVVIRKDRFDGKWRENKKPLEFQWFKWCGRWDLNPYVR